MCAASCYVPFYFNTDFWLNHDYQTNSADWMAYNDHINQADIHADSYADLNADTTVYHPLDHAPAPDAGGTVPGQMWKAGASDSHAHYIAESGMRRDAYIDGWIFAKTGASNTTPQYGLAAAPATGAGGTLAAGAAGLGMLTNGAHSPLPPFFPPTRPGYLGRNRPGSP